jgi:hypothetical protein
MRTHILLLYHQARTDTQAGIPYAAAKMIQAEMNSTADQIGSEDRVLTLKGRQRTHIAIVLQKRRKRLKIRVEGSSLDPGSVRPFDLDFGRFFPPSDFGVRQWRHSRDRKGYWFPQALRRSAALHW